MIEQMASELSAFQQDVSERLQKLLRNNLISESEYDFLAIEAKTTGDAVKNALNSRNHNHDSLEKTEQKIRLLLNRYKGKVNQLINSYEARYQSEEATGNNQSQKKKSQGSFPSPESLWLSVIPALFVVISVMVIVVKLFQSLVSWFFN